MQTSHKYDTYTRINTLKYLSDTDTSVPRHIYTLTQIRYIHSNPYTRIPYTLKYLNDICTTTHIYTHTNTIHTLEYIHSNTNIYAFRMHPNTYFILNTVYIIMFTQYIFYTLRQHYRWCQHSDIGCIMSTCILRQNLYWVQLTYTVFYIG